MVDASDERYRAPRAGLQPGGHIIYEEVGAFSFRQRLNRLRFACYSLTAVVVTALLLVLAGVLVQAAFGRVAGEQSALVVYGPLVLVAGVYQLSLVIRRLHDLGRSGWLILLVLVPVAEPLLSLMMPLPMAVALLLLVAPSLFTLYLFAAAGEGGMNRFGTPNPPNSGTVKVFGGICWVIGILGTLLQLALLTATVTAPEKVEPLLRALPFEQRQQMEQILRR